MNLLIYMYYFRYFLPKIICVFVCFRQERKKDEAILQLFFCAECLIFQLNAFENTEIL